MLREQLEQAGLANEALSQDIRKLTADWAKAREELEQKESDWRREEEVGETGSRTGGCLKDRKRVRIISLLFGFSLSTVTLAASTVGC